MLAYVRSIGGPDGWSAVRRLRVIAAGACVAASVAIAGVASAATVPVFGQAAELSLPGDAVTTGQSAQAHSVACPGAGACEAVGDYINGPTRTQPMVARQSGGVWGAASELSLPPNAASSAQTAVLFGVACTAAGACEAVGQYKANTGDQAPIVASETGGVWGQASQILPPANGAAAGHEIAFLTSVACTAGGNCEAVGKYKLAAGGFRAMAASETGGVWSQASELMPAANADPGANASAELSSVACNTAGRCEAVGFYKDNSGRTQPMMASETGGVWGQPTELTLPANAGAVAQFASLRSVACTGAGSCEAVGGYSDAARNVQAMVASETGGTWGQASELTLPANATTAAGQQTAVLDSVTCSAPGSCDGVGQYNDASGSSQQMAATETGGVWSQGTELAPPANARTGAGQGSAFLASIACAGVGTCEAVGAYVDTSGAAQAMAAGALPSLAIQSTALPNAKMGSSYSAQLGATGGAGMYSWSVSSGALPAGLHLDAHTGVISGTPRAAGAAGFTVQVSDPGPPAQTAHATLSITVGRPAPPDTIVTKEKVSSKHHSASFRIKSTGIASGLQCALVRVHGGKHHRRPRPHYRPCRASKRFTNLRRGRYVFYARAFGPGGVDRTPATRRFKIIS